MFKLVTILVLEFKKMESDDKTIYSTFYSNSKRKQFLMKVTLMMYLNQCILPLCQTTKSLGQVLGSIIDSVIEHNINVSKYNHLSGRSYIQLPK